MVKCTDVVIIGAARTPMGSFQGCLSHAAAVDLAATAISGAVQKSGVKLADVGATILGNVCSAGLGQAPARQAALKAGIPEEADSTTVNKVCASGMKAICIGADEIQLQKHDVIVAGGMESMTNVPYSCKSMRTGARMGSCEMQDLLIADCLQDATNKIHMGECAGKTIGIFDT